jgi:hypothetical protein
MELEALEIFKTVRDNSELITSVSNCIDSKTLDRFADAMVKSLQLDIHFWNEFSRHYDVMSHCSLIPEHVSMERNLLESYAIAQTGSPEFGRAMTITEYRIGVFLESMWNKDIRRAYRVHILSHDDLVSEMGEFVVNVNPILVDSIRDSGIELLYLLDKINETLEVKEIDPTTLN